MRGRSSNLRRHPEPRAEWIKFVERLRRETAARLSGGEPLDAFEMAALRRDAELMSSSFPVAHASARLVAFAARHLAQAYLVAGLVEDKIALARLLATAADFLDAKLTADGHALAQQSRRVAGETD